MVAKKFNPNFFGDEVFEITEFDVVFRPKRKLLEKGRHPTG